MLLFLLDQSDSSACFPCKLQAWLKPFKKDLSVSLDTVVILAEDCMLKQL